MRCLGRPIQRRSTSKRWPKRFEANRDRMAGAQGLLSGPSLLVFVSLAMPDPTLTRPRRASGPHQRRTGLAWIRERFAQADGVAPAAADRRAPGRSADRSAGLRSLCDIQGADLCACSWRCPGATVWRQYVPASRRLRFGCGRRLTDYALEYIERSSPRFSKEARGFIVRLRNYGS